jgi:MFS family permease
MMATLVVGPFYLSGALGLDAALVGLVLSVGPLVAALTGVPAGRIADRFGAQRMTIAGLIGMAAGSFILSMVPATLGCDEPSAISSILRRDRGSEICIASLRALSARSCQCSGF